MPNCIVPKSLSPTPKLDAWIHDVTDVYSPSSEQFKTLFPNGRNPFYKGKRTALIGAVKTLDETLDLYPSLAAVKTSVHDYYTLLYDSTIKQSGAKKSKKDGSEEVDLARIENMTIQFSDAGMLIYKYPTDAVKVSNFFDVEVLQEHLQNIFSGMVDPSAVLNVLIHTFSLTNTIEVNNLLGTDIRLFLSDTATTLTGNMVEILGNHKATIEISDFGVDVTTHRYLIIVNLNSTIQARYRIKI